MDPSRGRVKGISEEFCFSVLSTTAHDSCSQKCPLVPVLICDYVLIGTQCLAVLLVLLF